MSKAAVLSAIREVLQSAHGDGHPHPYPEGGDPRPYGKPGLEEMWQQFVSAFDALASYEDQRFG